MKKEKVSLTFPPSKITFPLMTLLVRNFDLEVNILHADIHLNKTGKLIVKYQEKRIVLKRRFSLSTSRNNVSPV